MKRTTLIKPGTFRALECGSPAAAFPFQKRAFRLKFKTRKCLPNFRERIPGCVSRVFPAVAAFFLVACGNPENRSEGNQAYLPRERQVVVLSPHGQEMLAEYEKAFEAAHPDIDVVGQFIPTGSILSGLRIDKSSPKVDVWWGGTSAFFDQAKADGLLQPYRPSWAEAAPAGFHDKEDYWYAQFIQVPAIMFNDAIYKPADLPQTWEELLDPKWKNKIAIREPMNSGTMKTILTGLVWMRGGNDGSPEEGYNFLKQLDAQTRSYLPDPQSLYDRIARSPEGLISLWNMTDILYQKHVNKYPFGYRIPESPVPVSVDPIGIIAGAPHPEEAKLFYEFVTSKENSLKMAKDHYRLLARGDLQSELTPELAAIRYTPMEIDLHQFDERQAEWMAYWQEKIRDPRK